MMDDDEDEFPFGAAGKAFASQLPSPDEVARMQEGARARAAFDKVVLQFPPDELINRYLNDPFFHAVVTVLEMTWQLRADGRVVSSPVEHCMALAYAVVPLVQCATLKEAAADLRKVDHALGPFTADQSATWLEERAEKLERGVG